MIDTTGRPPGTVHLARSFRSEHSADDKARPAAEQCRAFAAAMTDALPDGPELAAGLFAVH